MADPLTKAAVESKQSEVESLARKLATASSELANMIGEYALQEAQQALGNGAKETTAPPPEGAEPKSGSKRNG